LTAAWGKGQQSRKKSPAKKIKPLKPLAAKTIIKQGTKKELGTSRDRKTKETARRGGTSRKEERPRGGGGVNG